MNNNAVDSPSDVDDIKKRNRTMSEIVTLYVNGAAYELEVDDIRRAPGSRLYRNAVSGRQTSLHFKRPVQSFEAVLAYYQTGELHMPMTVCPGAFKQELRFWEIDPQVMSKCCYYKFLSHLEDQETLWKFHCHLFPNLGQPKQPRRWFRGLRTSLWKILDNVDSSVPTKIYFVLNMLLVILSVLTLAVSTLPYFRRSLTMCEYEVALGRPLKLADGATNLTDSCDTPLSDEELDALLVDDPELYQQTTETTAANARPPGVGGMSKTTPGFDGPMMNSRFMPNGSLSRSLFIESDVSDEKFLNHIVDELRPGIGLKKKTVRIRSLAYIDFALLAFFSLDLILRLLCCPSVCRYFLSAVNVIDASAVLAQYSHLVINALDEREKYESTGLDFLEVVQVFRAVRLLRVAQNVTGFKVLSFTLKVSFQDLLVLFLYILLTVVIFANFIFFVEDGGTIDSIPMGWWWAINTLTTVGYGDAVPKSLYGRLIGAMCAVIGVLMMSVAIPVFVKTFMLLYQYAVLYKKAIENPAVTHAYLYRQTKASALDEEQSLPQSKSKDGTP